MKRRDKIVDHFEKLIAEKGEYRVLYWRSQFSQKNGMGMSLPSCITGNSGPLFSELWLQFFVPVEHPALARSLFRTPNPAYELWQTGISQTYRRIFYRSHIATTFCYVLSIPIGLGTTALFVLIAMGKMQLGFSPIWRGKSPHREWSSKQSVPDRDSWGLKAKGWITNIPAEQSPCECPQMSNCEDKQDGRNKTGYDKREMQPTKKAGYRFFTWFKGAGFEFFAQFIN